MRRFAPTCLAFYTLWVGIELREAIKKRFQAAASIKFSLSAAKA